jgi:hypothetical protein
LNDPDDALADFFGPDLRRSLFPDLPRAGFAADGTRTLSARLTPVARDFGGLRMIFGINEIY